MSEVWWALCCPRGEGPVGEGDRAHPVRRRIPPIGTHHARTELRSTRSSLECRGGRVSPAQAPQYVQEGGKNALGGLIPFFLYQVKRLKG